MTPETKVKAKVKKWAEYKGGFLLPISQRYHSGTPDFIHFQDGKASAIEVKAPDGKMSKIQKVIAGEFMRNGITYFIATIDAKNTIKLIDLSTMEGASWLNQNKG